MRFLLGLQDMVDYDFSQPQRQSAIGVLLIFVRSLVHLGRNLWVVVVYFLMQDNSSQELVAALPVVGLLLVLTGIYSYLSYTKFKFHIDQVNQKFVQSKGVFASNLIEIPFNKIQQVSFRRNILERAIGVYSIVIETAGSQEKEVEIKALSQGKADALTKKLMAVTRASASMEEEKKSSQQTAATDPQWEYRVNLVRLLKLGLSSNYLRGVALILTFYLTLRQRFFRDGRLSQYFQPEVDFAGNYFLLILVLLVVGIFITLGDTVVKYFGLHLSVYPDLLQIQMGLRNNRRISLKPGRVQLIRVYANPVQRRLGLWGLKISVVSSEDEIEKNQIKIPGLSAWVLDQLKVFFHGGQMQEKLVLRPQRFYLLSRLFQSLILIVPSTVLFFMFQEHFWKLLWFLLVLCGLIWTYCFLNFKNLRLVISDNFLIKNHGIWVRQQQFLELYKLQSVSVRQSVWSQSRGLVSITFHSAAGDISFPMLRREEAEPLLDFVLYKIESTSRPWM